MSYYILSVNNYNVRFRNQITAQLIQNTKHILRKILTQ